MHDSPDFFNASPNKYFLSQVNESTWTKGTCNWKDGHVSIQDLP